MSWNGVIQLAKKKSCDFITSLIDRISVKRCYSTNDFW